MSAVALHITSHQFPELPEFQCLHIRITAPTGLIEPSDLKGLELPEGVNWRQGIVIEGKAPIWLYAYLVHRCHPSAWVACYDPRLGAVVVSTHTPSVTDGSVFDVRLSDSASSNG